MHTLNFNHLRYFWAVAHEGGISRAAERLNLSPSALSVQIQKLEHQLGHALFDRVGKRLLLTEAGGIALDYADTVFRAGSELISTLGGQSLASPPGAAGGRAHHAVPQLSAPVPAALGRPCRRGADRALRHHAGPAGPARGACRRRRARQQRSPARRAGPVPQSPAQPAARQPGRPAAARGAAIPVSRGPPHRNPFLLPSLDSDIRVAFDTVMELAGIRPIIMAEVDDMAILRLLAREREGVTLVPPIVGARRARRRGAGGALPAAGHHREVLCGRAEQAISQPAAR